jgi:hypothetical protein
MSYRFTVINTYSAFMKESESEVLCTDSTVLRIVTVSHNYLFLYVAWLYCNMFRFLYKEASSKQGTTQILCKIT